MKQKMKNTPKLWIGFLILFSFLIGMTMIDKSSQSSVEMNHAKTIRVVDKHKSNAQDVAKMEKTDTTGESQSIKTINHSPQQVIEVN